MQKNRMTKPNPRDNYKVKGFSSEREEDTEQNGNTGYRGPDHKHKNKKKHKMKLKKKSSLKKLKAKYLRAKAKYLKEKKRHKKYDISSSSSSESSSGSSTDTDSESSSQAHKKRPKTASLANSGQTSRRHRQSNHDDVSEEDNEQSQGFLSQNTSSRNPVDVPRGSGTHDPKVIWQHPDEEDREKYKGLDELIKARRRKRQHSPILLNNQGQGHISSSDERNHKVSRFFTNSTSRSPLTPNCKNDVETPLKSRLKSKPKSRLSNSLSTHRLQIVEGDATTPIGEGNKIIAHICNTAGGWGKGFVLALSKRWHLPEQEYRNLCTPIDLGFVQFVTVTQEITVANMVAQTAPQTSGPPPIKYDALRTTLKTLGSRALETEASIHMPKIGTGLSRGNWDVICDIIKEELINLEIPVYVYVYGQ